jgi:iron uptake system EfeUOB component EfeO/EfeM
MRRVALAVGFVALVVLLVGALLPTGGRGRFAVRTLAPAAALTPPSKPLVAHVVGSDIPASRYGGIIARLENGGTNADGQLVSELSPIPPSRFDAPIAEYRSYAVKWAHATAAAVAAMRSALAHGTRAFAQSAWLAAWTRYLRLGAVYGLIGSLDTAIDGMPGELGSTSFRGLHRIELGLWTGATLRSLKPLAAALAASVARLPHAVEIAAITPLDYATRAHEILEDAQRDLLSGSDVQWSGEGVSGTAMGVAATREVIATLVPLLQGRDNTLVEVQNELELLSATLTRIRMAHGGDWPSLAQLSLAEHDRLDATMAGALTQLAQLPGTLETAPTPTPPPLP